MSPISALQPGSRSRCPAGVRGGQRPPPARPATPRWPLPRRAPSFVWSTIAPPDGVAWPAASSSQSLILSGPSRAVGRTPGNWHKLPARPCPDCPLVPSPQGQAAQGRLGHRCTWGRCMPSGSRHNHRDEMRVRDWAGRRQAPCSPEAGRHSSPPPLASLALMCQGPCGWYSKGQAGRAAPGQEPDQL